MILYHSHGVKKVLYNSHLGFICFVCLCFVYGWVMFVYCCCVLYYCMECTGQVNVWLFSDEFCSPVFV